MKPRSHSKTDGQRGVPRRTFLKFSVEAMAIGALIGCRPKSPGGHRGRRADVTTYGCRYDKRVRGAPSIPVDNVINWDDGRRIKVLGGQTATCSTLNPGQLYCIFLYNSSDQDQDIDVTVVWSNAAPPVIVTVPGTTANEGPASLVLASGSDTSTISVAITQTGNANIECWLGSVEMPTNTSSLSDRQLAPDGVPRRLAKDSRYYTVPQSTWYQFTITSKFNQSTVVQFRQRQVIIYLVNPTSNTQVPITALGSITQVQDYVIQTPPSGSQPQRVSFKLQGDGTSWVWMSADSEQNAQSTFITLQSLDASS